MQDPYACVIKLADPLCTVMTTVCCRLDIQSSHISCGSSTALITFVQGGMSTHVEALDARLQCSDTGATYLSHTTEGLYINAQNAHDERPGLQENNSN